MILVPRPAPHLPRTLEALQAAGHTHLIPLALSEPQPHPVTLPPTTTALILTSRFGIFPNNPFKHLPTYCVGGCTAKEAIQHGYNVVYTGTNNAIHMAQTITTQHPTPNTQHNFVHLHGDQADTTWHTLLENAGHRVTSALAYTTERLTSLPSSVTEKLHPYPPITLLFSAGSASHLANLLKQATIHPNGTAVAFSPAVARAAAPHWPTVATAPASTLESLIATISPLLRSSHR